MNRYWRGGPVALAVAVLALGSRSAAEGERKLPGLDALYPSLDALYQDLHRHPEP